MPPKNTTNAECDEIRAAVIKEELRFGCENAAVYWWSRNENKLEIFPRLNLDGFTCQIGWAYFNKDKHLLVCRKCAYELGLIW